MYCKVGVTHLGFCVDDLDEAVEAMKRLGCELITPPFGFEPHIEYAAEPSQEKLRRATRPVGKTYWKLAMLSDPDGIILELLER
jgi:catechol 2,3-dioxygenase-like lactoylglutathione lyase family enzyme